MQVSIKKFDVQMDIKTNGVELGISEPKGGAHLGDLYVTKTSVIWCKGKTTQPNGKKLSWKEFMALMEAQQKPKAKRARKKKSN